MRFDPQPADILHVAKQDLEFTPHPSSCIHMAYAQEGRKGIVYQVRRKADGRLFALKMFKPSFRGAYLADVARRIAPLSHLPGMIACQRTVLSRQDHALLVHRFPELEHAMLMPWVADETWQDVFILNRLLSHTQSLELAISLADILDSLESRGLVHCDICAGNVLVNSDRRRVNLVDLEEMFGTGIDSLHSYPTGSPGYQHETSRSHPKGQWRPHGDRFSGAVLLAEMLACHDPLALQAADGEHFFSENEMQKPSSERFKLILEIVGGMSQQLASLFERAWRSRDFEDCPCFAEWGGALRQVYQAAGDLEKAVAEGDDRQIVHVITHNQGLLSGFQLVDMGSRTLLTRRRQAQDYQERLAGIRAMEIDALSSLVEERLQRRDSLLAALAQGTDQQIELAYEEYNRFVTDPEDLSSAQRQQLQAALNRARRSRRQNLLAAVWADDDFEIADRFEPDQLDAIQVDPDDLVARADIADRRVSALQQIRSAADQKNHALVVQLHEQWRGTLRGCSQYTTRDRRALMTARQVLARQELDRAISAGSDKEIQTAFRAAVATGNKLDTQQLQAVRAAKKRTAATERNRKKTESTQIA
jgi:serine/threonine protein kinase